MRKLILLFVALLVVVMAAPVGATTPLEVTFEDETIFDAGLLGGGPFWASGPAVDAGIMCGSGEQVDVSAKAVGYQNNKRVNLQVFKEFTCDDEPLGSFTLKLQIKIVFPSEKNGFTGENNFNWVIVGGTGAYDDLHGTGKGTGVDLFDGPPPPVGVENTYTGRLHNN